MSGSSHCSCDDFVSRANSGCFRIRSVPDGYDARHDAGGGGAHRGGERSSRVLNQAAPICAARSQTVTMGFPAWSASGLPGKRLDA